VVKNFKYKPGRSDPKKIFLPDSEPCPGQDGGDVVFYCDTACQSLLHLQDGQFLQAQSGARGNPSEGTRGPKRRQQEQRQAPALKIPVPAGTLVRRKGSGKVLGELLKPGDFVVAARGGRGGLGVKRRSREQNQRFRAKQREAEAEGGMIVEDKNWKADTRGLSGERVTVQLLLRVVADVGLVGLPNAGKSSLLKQLTNASPEIANYPFTTLTPNLGVADGVGRATLADLPGLIDGAHRGRGLGRIFLRHLRRAKVIMHVVDASAEDPVADYRVIRDELRMYNPEYVRRPHLVCLNKIDLGLDEARLAALRDGVLAAAVAPLLDTEGEAIEGIEPLPPAAVVPVSAFAGLGVDAVQDALRELLPPGEGEEGGGFADLDLGELDDGEGPAGAGFEDDDGDGGGEWGEFEG